MLAHDATPPENLWQLRALVLVKQSQYQDMISAAPAGGVFAQAAAQTGIPPWALYVIGGLLLWKLVYLKTAWLENQARLSFLQHIRLMQSNIAEMLGRNLTGFRRNQ